MAALVNVNLVFPKLNDIKMVYCLRNNFPNQGELVSTVHPLDIIAYNLTQKPEAINNTKNIELNYK